MKQKIKRFKNRAKLFPSLPGVYIIKKHKDQVIYVGKAKSLRARVLSYFNTKITNLKTEFLIRRAEAIDYIVTENEVEAFLLESSLVKKHKPRYNVRLKDDKAYPYIRLNLKEDFPRFYFERKVKDPHSIYFGPYTEATTLKALLDFLNQNFLLRDCSNTDFKSRSRPCLSWELGTCSAPCVRKVTKKEYQKQCKKALSFLKGQSKGLIKELNVRMALYSKKMRFEQAALLRDRLKAIQMIEAKQSVIKNSEKDKDAIALKAEGQALLIEVLHFRRGRLIGNRSHFFNPAHMQEEFFLSFLNQYYCENIIPDELLLKLPIKAGKLKVFEKSLKARKGSTCKALLATSLKLSATDKDLISMAENNAKNHFKNKINQEQNMQIALTEIQKAFRLPDIPLRIECYDVSHWQGRYSIGSQVVFIQGQPEKANYRLYNLKSTTKGDDYLALQELLSRRLKHKEYKTPHMILIDGGRGQLKAVQKILKDFKMYIPIVSLAKDRAKNKGPYTKRVSPSSGERFYLPNRKNPVTFPSTSKALKILLQLRDEAHRFAIHSHRKKRNKMFLPKTGTVKRGKKSSQTSKKKAQTHKKNAQTSIKKPQTHKKKTQTSTKKPQTHKQKTQTNTKKQR